MRWVFAALGLPLVPSWACGPPGHEEPPPNVVIFLIDTVRADRLGVYGYEKETSPYMEALARAGVVFEEAHAPAPWTLPSVASLMLSQFPGEHGVLVDQDLIAPESRTLAERLKQAGYPAAASYFRNPYAGRMTGLERGYDVWQLLKEDEEIDGADVAGWLDALPARPFYLYLHNMGGHDPWVPAPEHLAPFGPVPQETMRGIASINRAYRALTREEGTSPAQDAEMRRLQSLRTFADRLYDAELRQADALLGSVIDALKAAGDWENTLFIVLSDHGEELGDRGGWQHDHSVYEELLRVPLIIRFPDDAHAGLRISGPVSLVDVMPTILDFVGRPELARDCRGESLLPRIYGSPSVEGHGMRVTAQRINRKKHYAPFKETRGDENLVVREGPWKGIWNVELGTFELYHLERDPGERDDVAASEPERVSRMLAYAEAQHALFEQRRWAGVDEAGALDADDLEGLRELGYAGEDR